MDRVEIARLFLHVREAGGQNRGLRVEAIQHWSGGQTGDSWCMELAWMVLDLESGGQSPVPRMQSVQEFRAFAEREGWAVTDPEPGDLFVYVDANDHAHHIGLYTGADDDGTPVGIAGNTSADGTSSNGDRVAEHPLRPGSATRILYFRVPAAA